MIHREDALARRGGDAGGMNPTVAIALGTPLRPAAPVIGASAGTARLFERPGGADIGRSHAIARPAPGRYLRPRKGRACKGWTGIEPTLARTVDRLPHAQWVTVADLGDQFLSHLRYSDKIIAFADVVESVRLIERDEARAVSRIARLLVELARGIVGTHGGQVVERRGDGLLLEFSDARAAVACAAQLHGAARDGNAGLAAEDCIHLRVGVHRAGVFADEAAIYGRGVNLAARITAQAGAGETVVSAAVAGELVDGLDGDLADLGECYLKHVASPVHLYRVGRGQGAPIRFRGPGLPLALMPTIAVLPFTPYRPEGSAFGVGDIITDQVIGALSRSNAISVISRLSTTALRGRELALHEVAHLLSANFVASGRFWRSAGKVFVQAELAAVDSGQVIWSDTVSDSEESALYSDSALIGELLLGIAGAIFAAELRRARTMPLPNLASHTLLLAAISQLYRLARIDFDHAHEALLALHERAPRHPTPLAWLARWHLFRVVQGWSQDRDKDGRMALSYADRALDIDPESSLALTMAGNVHTSYLRDLETAERFYDAALTANPNESLAWLQKGNERSFRGDGAGALSHIEKALTLSPFDPSRHFYESLLASAALSAGDYGRAISAAKSSLRLNSQHVSSHRVLAIAQSLTGDIEQAAETVQHILRLEPGLTVASFVARSPGGKSGLAGKFGQALHAAGLPLGEANH